MKKILFVIIVFVMDLMIHACVTLPASTQHYYSGSSKIITGGFGYKFGDVLDKSLILEHSLTANPSFTEGYMVKPIVNNKEFDYYTVEVCKRTKRIYLISGFKIYNSRNEAMRKLYEARQIIQKKYGALKKLSDNNNFYAEYLEYGPYQVRLIATPGNFTPPKWGFSIMYASDEHKRQCNSLF